MSFKFGNFELTATRKDKIKGFLPSLTGPVIALLLAFSVAAVIMMLSGANPVIAYQSMFYGAFGSIGSTAETLVKATPLMLCGVGLTVAYRTGMISVGAEGQMVMGGLTATLAGLAFPGLPAIIIIPLMMLAGMLGGAALASIPGFLKAKLGVSEVINTIMLNYISIFFVAFLLDGPLREPPGYFPQSAQISKAGWLPTIIPGTRLHIGVLFALASAFIVYFILWRLPLGFQMRAVGFNQSAAKNSGIKVGRNLVLSLALSGAFAGLAGMVEIAGIQHRLLNGFSSEYGFDAMAVALLGKLHPAGIVVAAIFFAALRVGANMMQRTVQVPASLVFVIQGLVILFVLLERLINSYTIKIFARKQKEAN